MPGSFIAAHYPGSIRKGDDRISQEEYLKYLLEQYQNLIYSICLKSVGNPFDAEDHPGSVSVCLQKPFFLKSMAEQNRCTQVSDFLGAGRRSIPTEDTYFSQIPTSSTPEALYLKNRF